ncbi:A/G-specific adenine glycosylase [Legionella micdadei]|uniref:A/G-specific adenine glycosylase n=1 Tax=Legionella micdadei TaxID=451 RepID=UPI0009EF7C1C|nr:A/G-specific adenine glycosylase [Legionella micdadei]ARG99881.1 A/G-specific adenine glycosylase [Legionella micdadei]NSL18717.1 A/G-specific adenine glycosylase [Legionella micdadei]
MIQEQFTTPLLRWFDIHGRKDLPWQHPRTAYRVWISEIMLQQTQVKTVIPYFERFIDHFPDIWQLARADEDGVLALWSGLGYYSRARNIHKTAKIICEQYQGEFPSDLTNLKNLPGIGPSTAAAIASQAFAQATPILDGNVKRVLCRYFLVDGWPEQNTVKRELWRLAAQCMSRERCADYTQAIMDLGATCCTSRNPNCANCPLNKTCLAKLQDKVSLYPHKKIKKALPVKQQQFLLLYNHEKEIYLERRPPTGIWGGLWCMPAIDLDHCPKEYIEKTYAMTSVNRQELLNMRHTFSHFHLEIKALAFQTVENQFLIEEPSGKWFKATDINQLGLAKPVSKILNYFFALGNSSHKR